jgi:hypothetical protein|tara:strand:- start:1052 stop:1909 length:858 start_codon:yes stop_codon:yes gene_type:complete
MPRIAAISLARLSLRNISKKRLLQLINLIIFISLFAVTAAIISLVFEKKIEEQNKQLSNELGNEIIYNHWLATAPKNISNIENILFQVSKEHNYLIYIKGLNEELITERHLAHNPVMDLLRFIRSGSQSINYSLNDALLISSSLADLYNILEFKKEHQRIANKFWKVEDENKLFTISMTYTMEQMSEDEISNLYKKALLAKKDLKIILNEIKNLNIMLNINYYSQKKTESQKKISKIKKNIKRYSQNESRSILIAFFIQLVIFALIQFFEFGFELIQGRSLRKGK